MLFNDIMHVSFYTNKMDEMIDFYTNKLGGETKTLTRYKAYLDRDDRPEMQAVAKANPEGIFNTYIELAPNQFIELFPGRPDQIKDESKWNSKLGYTHFALTCNDIYETKRILEEKGVVFFNEPSKGPSETYQMWTADPDGNMFEIMQYTENSYQVKGHID